MMSVTFFYFIYLLFIFKKENWHVFADSTKIFRRDIRDKEKKKTPFSPNYLNFPRNISTQNHYDLLPLKQPIVAFG